MLKGVADFVDAGGLQPATVGDRSGAIISLRNFRRLMMSKVPLDDQDAEEIKSMCLEVDAVIDLFDDLLKKLPPGHTLASIMASTYSRQRAAEEATGSPVSMETRKLRDASLGIESILERCHSTAISTNLEAVADAHRICLEVVRRQQGVPLVVTRGDALGINFHGAMIRAAFRSGDQIELSLRRAHPEYESVKAGTWLIEGGAMFCPSKNRTPICIEEELGEALPEDVLAVICRHISSLASSCTDVRHLRVIP